MPLLGLHLRHHQRHAFDSGRCKLVPVSLPWPKPPHSFSIGSVLGFIAFAVNNVCNAGLNLLLLTGFGVCLARVRLFKMFFSSGSPDGVSLHRSPPYASKTRAQTLAAENPGISSPSVSPGGRVQLTIKSPYSSKVAAIVERFVDPSPDWTLQDLQSELDVIAKRYTSTVSLDNTPPPSTARG